jgi:hypothetical protein
MVPVLVLTLILPNGTKRIEHWNVGSAADCQAIVNDENFDIYLPDKPEYKGVTFNDVDGSHCEMFPANATQVTPEEYKTLHEDEADAKDKTNDTDDTTK